jgi:D-alanyl-D-alanine carboxypeptidase
MAKSLEEWKNQVYGKTIDLDNQSFDCVDVSKHWIVYLSGVRWQESAGWGNAKDIYSFWHTTYLEKVPRGNAPKLGDIVVMNGQIGGGYGHTGVVVGIDGQNITIYQQNTFTQQPVYTGTFNAYVSYITGFLRPKVSFDINMNTPMQPYQRKTVNDTVNYRDAASLSGVVLQKFNPNEVYDFKGWVHGEAVEGNNVWFVGRYTGGYAWSGAFTDKETHDLADLNPTQLHSYQRQVANAIVNYRRAPVLMPDNVIRTFQPGEILDFDAYTHATSVDGIDVWFRGRYTGGWSHAGGFTDQSTNGLVEVKIEPVEEPPVPTYPKPTEDSEVTKVYNKKRALSKDYAPTDLVSVGGGQQLRKEAAESLKLMQQQTSSLAPASGYRSYDTQALVYQQNVDKYGKEEADRQSARPGYSEHQTGLAMDFGPIDESFENTPAYKWLTEYAYKYGWVLRYPEGKESVTGYMYEPWHWRYVGTAVADDMQDTKKTTLEEYFNVEGGGYVVEPKPENPTNPDPTPDDPTKNPLWQIFVAFVSFLKSIIDRLSSKK